MMLGTVRGWLTERQLRKRMEVVLDEVGALGGAHRLPVGQIRYCLLLRWSGRSRRCWSAGLRT